MPNTKLKFNTESEIPASLKPNAVKVGDSYEVEVYYGGSDLIAGELNPALEANKNTILKEKNDVEAKYNNLLTSTSTLSTENQELRVKLANGQTVTPEDVKLLEAIKPYGGFDTIKPKLDNYDSVANELTATKTQVRNKRIFDALGFSNEQIFNDLISNPAKLEGVSDVVFKEEGGKVNVFAKTKTETGEEKEVAFTDFIKNNEGWKPYLGSLKKDTVWFEQREGGGQPKTNGLSIDTVIEQDNVRATASNPLKPAPIENK